MTSSGYGRPSSATAQASWRSWASARRQPRAVREQRHGLAGVVAAGPGRVAAVVRAEHQQVARAQRGEQRRQARVEGFERGTVAQRVAAMAVHAVEIDEVDRDQRAVARARGRATEHEPQPGRQQIGQHIGRVAI